ncbi:MAG TPA: acetolactate decarboxylase, partial [Flavobacteriales bacterium]|nr:acetolactate decarboxylase [Flavobacteriales bacterium]
VRSGDRPLGRGLTTGGPVVPTGAMRNTMFNGQLAGLIQLDSIAKRGTYGIGPVEFIHGELMLWDGHVYRSTAQGDSAMLVEERPASKAPFFVHQVVKEWTAVALPDSVTDLPALDAFLTARYASIVGPFAFKLRGAVSEVHAHIVDVSPGTVINGPDDAHRENKHFMLRERTMDLLGFFSTRHKAVFTHHDTNIHVHAITAERDWMGHVEEMRFQVAEVRLFVALPDR